MNEEFVISLDIGSSQVRVIVAEFNTDGVAHIVGVGTAKSAGMKKGAIINIDQAVQSIREAIENAERMAGIEISEIYVGIANNQVLLQSSHGVVAVSSEDREIGSQDIDRVLQAARVIALPPERAIIEVVPKQFIVDGLNDIKDPNGMIGVRLEVDALIITGAKTMIHNMLRCVEKADLSIAGIMFLPLAVSEFCLSVDEKNLGVLLVDVGGGTTTLTLFQQGQLISTSMVPVGGEYITNDIAVGLRIQTEEAEKIKCKFGVACKEKASNKESFQVKLIGTNEEITVTQAELAQVIEPRVEELFQLIQQQVIEMGFTSSPAGGFVLTGGVMGTPHILNIAKKHLGNSVRIASPKNLAAKEPSYTGGVGMIEYLQKSRMVHRGDVRVSPAKHKKHKNRTTLDKVRTWLNEFI